MQSPTNQNRNKRNMKYDLSKIELSEKNFKFSKGLNKALFIAMNKLELYKIVDIVTFCKTIHERDSRLDEMGINHNFDGCELFTPEQTQPMYEWFKEKVGIGEFSESEFYMYRAHKISLKKIFFEIPSLFINLYNDKKLNLTSFNNDSQRFDANIFKLDYNNDDIPFVSFLKEQRLSEAVRATLGQQILVNSTMATNQSLFDGIPFVFNSNGKPIYFNSVLSYLASIKDISFNFDTFEVRQDNITIVEDIHSLHIFKHLVEAIEKLGKPVNYDKIEFNKKVKEAIENLTDKEKQENLEVINHLQSKQTRQQKKVVL